jgi:arsenite methyltransferase
MEFHIDVSHHVNTSWDTFINSSPHPWAPPLSTIFAEQFTEEERLIFEQAFRPLVGAPKSTATSRIAYLTALKPVECVCIDDFMRGVLSAFHPTSPLVVRVGRVR